MRNDLHIHTAYSADAETTMEAYCARAVELGMKYICFTDHLDCNPLDTGCGYYEPQRYFEGLEKARKRWGDRVTILAGVEFAEPHLHRALLKEYHTYPYDFIIGSIHWVGDLFPSRMMRDGIPDIAYTDGYWREIYCAAEYGGFHSLGHLDFPKRYFGSTAMDRDLIAEALTMLVQKGILIEINTSSLRKGLTETMPGMELLRLYREVGGTHVTIGSDAHFAEDLSADHDTARAMMDELGLREAVFIGGKMVEV